MSGSGRLIYTVHVTDDKGKPHVFGPADEKLPDWALGKIGAHAFEDGEHPKPSALKKAAAAPSLTVGDEAGELQKRIRELEAENETLRADLAKYREADGSGGGAFDPSEHTVDEVNEYLEHADEDEVARVLKAESDASKPRAGIVNGPHAAADS